MINRVLVALLLFYSLFALVKFSFFFVLSYERRRRALDNAYAGRSSATRSTDVVLLIFALLLAGLLAARGSEPVSFLAGLLIGMTLIQLYFHQFAEPLLPAQHPREPSSPIKLMSYGIQAKPGRAWKEMATIAILIVWAAIAICRLG